MRLTRTLGGLLAVLALLAVAAPAHAGQFVFERGASGVWAMNEDGSGAPRKLVDLSQVPGMSEIDTASVRPNGTEVAFVAGWSGATAEMERWSPWATGYCGDGCLGYYELRNGALQRMTEGPAQCPGSQPCKITENDARVAVDGSVAFSYDAEFASQSCPGCDWYASSSESEPRLRTGDGRTTTKVVSPCADPATTLDRPAPNPTNAREVLYRGCLDSSNADEELARSGADPSDPSDDVGLVDESVGADFVGYDWRPDGAQIAFTDTGGSQNGLQVADLGAADQPAQSLAFVLASPSGTTFYSPRYVGSDRIAFVANGDIWMVPTSCESGGCSFPGSAKRLTSFGDVGPAIGYTTSDATIPAVPEQSGGGGGGTGGGGGSPPPPPPPARHTLTVARAGSGSGSVTSAPAGIDCGSSCSHAFAAGAAVTLTAAPGSGSRFAGWSGAGCSGTGTCTVRMGADASVTATFAAKSSSPSPPDTRITRAKIRSGKRRAVFEFKAGGHVRRFQCELKRKHHRARFQRCGPRKHGRRGKERYKHLRPGRYVFKVRAVGPGGKDPTPARKHFRIRKKR